MVPSPFTATSPFSSVGMVVARTGTSWLWSSVVTSPSIMLKLMSTRF